MITIVSICSQSLTCLWTKRCSFYGNNHKSFHVWNFQIICLVMDNLWCIVGWLIEFSSWINLMYKLTLWSIDSWQSGIMWQCDLPISINTLLYFFVNGCSYIIHEHYCIPLLSFSWIKGVNVILLPWDGIFCHFLKVGPLAAYYQVPLRHILLVCIFVSWCRLYKIKKCLSSK